MLKLCSKVVAVQKLRVKYHYSEFNKTVEDCYYN